MKTLSPKRALWIMAEVVLEHGADHVYEKVQEGEREPACTYTQKDEKGDDCPSCLVGHVMLRWGLPLDFLVANNRCGIQSLSYHINKSNDLAFQVSTDAIHVLGAAQESQDEGDTWGTALAKAVLTFTNLDAED